MCVRVLRCVMSFLRSSLSEVVKKKKPPSEVCNHYRHLGLSVGAALVMKNGMREKRKAKKERKKEDIGEKDVSKGESENERVR